MKYTIHAGISGKYWRVIIDRALFAEHRAAVRKLRAACDGFYIMDEPDEPAWVQGCFNSTTGDILNDRECARRVQALANDLDAMGYKCGGTTTELRMLQLFRSLGI